MSWDVALSRPSADGAEDGLPLGPADEVRASISRIHPGVDWTDPAWGVLDGDGWSIEFNIGAEPVVGSMMLHVRGSGDPVAAIAAISRDTGWWAYDLTTDEYLDPQSPSSRGWKDFQKFRYIINTELAAPGEVTALPLVHLKLQGSVLHRSQGRAGARSHDLSKASAVGFERGTNWVSIVFGLVLFAVGLAVKAILPVAWLGWLVLSAAFVFGAIFLLSARGDWLVIHEAGKKYRYPLVGTPGEVLGFRATIEAVAARLPSS